MLVSCSPREPYWNYPQCLEDHKYQTILTGSIITFHQIRTTKFHNFLLLFFACVVFMHYLASRNSIWMMFQVVRVPSRAPPEPFRIARKCSDNSRQIGHLINLTLNLNLVSYSQLLFKESLISLKCSFCFWSPLTLRYVWNVCLCLKTYKI